MTLTPDTERAIPVLIPGRWALYVACAETDSGGVVKIGISSVPTTRVIQVNEGSPFPITAMLFAWVGTRSTAARLERGVHALFAARRTRGEWFRFDFGSADDKAVFHDGIRGQYRLLTGRKLVWQAGEVGTSRPRPLGKPRRPNKPKRVQER